MGALAVCEVSETRNSYGPSLTHVCQRAEFKGGNRLDGDPQAHPVNISPSDVGKLRGMPSEPKLRGLPLLIRHENPPDPVILGFKNVSGGRPICEIAVMSAQPVISVGANSAPLFQKMATYRAYGRLRTSLCQQPLSDGDYSTHRVVRGYEPKSRDSEALTADAQHSEFRWWSERDLSASERVHDKAKAYAGPSAAR